MSVSWYYVEGSERVGPIEENGLATLINSRQLDQESFVWRKGLDNWAKIKDMPELQKYFKPSTPSSRMADEETISLDLPPLKTFDWKRLDLDARVFTIKIGADRGVDECEYGPFSMNMIKKMFNENRINASTLIFTHGMDKWMFLGDTPVYKEFISDVPPVIDEVQRRRNVRRPFVARLLFHDRKEVYDGVCRDISIGGMQILMSGFPARVGDRLEMNVHPESSSHTFVASGEIVRILEGGQGFSLRFVGLNNRAKEVIEDYINNVPR